MWFRMPKDTGAISVEQQQFSAIVKDDEGFGYFQAPDHFSPQILSLKGFESCDRPKNVPKSVTNIDPKRDVTVKNLSDQVSSQNATIADLRTSIGSLNGELRSEKTKNAELMQQMAEKVAENAALRERLAEHEEENETNEAIAKTIPELIKSESDEEEDD